MSKVERFLHNLIESAKAYRTVVIALSCVVVFITTYLLILPAITLTADKAKDQGGITVAEETAETEESTAASDTSKEIVIEPRSSDTKDSEDTDNAQKDSAESNSSSSAKSTARLAAPIVLKAAAAQNYFYIRVNDSYAGSVTSKHVTQNAASNVSYYNGKVVSYDVFNYRYDVLHFGVNASANSGYRFVRWVDGEGNTDVYTNVNNARVLAATNSAEYGKEYIAYFAPSNAYLVMVTSDTVTGGSVSGGTTAAGNSTFPTYGYSNGSTVFKATPSNGYYFKGWYDKDGNLVSQSQSFKASDATEDLVLTPVFDTLHTYSIISNSNDNSYPGTFTSKRWSGNVTSISELGQAGEGGTVMYYGTVPQPASGYEFAYWLKDDGTTPVVSGKNLAANNLMTRDTTFIAFFAPTGQKVVRLEWWDGNMGNVSYTGVKAPRTVSTSNPDGVYNTTYFYYFSGDNETLTATAHSGYEFAGWYDGDKLISASRSFPVSEATDHIDITPVFEPDENNRDYYNVWFDGTNGLSGGDSGTKQDTFYSRYTGQGVLQGSTSEHAYVQKSSPYVQLPETAEAPLGQEENGFVLKGWYCINDGDAAGYHEPGEWIYVDRDYVFYADWAPENYDIGQDVDTIQTTDTSGFITTRVFDYNNLFNISTGSAVLDDKSYINSRVNYEYWNRDASGLDFLFISSVSDTGRSLNPAGRELSEDDTRNHSRENTNSGYHYTGIPSTGILDTEGLREALFSPSYETAGKVYAGEGNYLYKYDTSTGYYYYDSDLNAASYNASDERFYVYNYTNSTDKSTSADNPDYTDFIPLNYGDKVFTEHLGQVNYWFGMSSEIDFFLPNETGYTDENGMTGNRSVKGDEMVYKFSGDDDVWVFVDDQLVLDLGGIHGKIYGEINFSAGTYTIASNGANKTVDSRGIMSYDNSAGDIYTDTLDLPEGNHKLTMYYLERGASQSNCAIYFNLAPRYTLDISKTDSGSNAALEGAAFAVYTDIGCTVAASMLENEAGTRTNKFTTDEDGEARCYGLSAGKTYYIKELKAPDGYPDVSQEIITLRIDSGGNPSVVTSADDDGWTMASVTTTESSDDSRGSFNIGLSVKNRKLTSVTSKKIWSVLDGSTYSIDENTEVGVKLQRYSLPGADDTTEAAKHTVRLLTRYFADDDTIPVATDEGILTVYQSYGNLVDDGGSIAFDITTGNGVAIYSVASQYGSIESEYSNNTEGKPYTVEGGKANLPQSGHFELSDITRDTTIYITYIGAAESPDALIANTAIGETKITAATGTRKVRIQDDEFNDSQSVQTLDKSNSWKYTWTDLPSDDGNGNQYYYYVTETTSDGLEIDDDSWNGKTFVATYSSDGISSGTIAVNNTLEAVRVKLRKCDAADGTNLPGAEFQIYTAEEYAKGEDKRTPIDMSLNTGLVEEQTWKDGDGTTLVGDELGRFYLGYLPAGTFYLVETQAPENYDRLDDAIMIEITENGDFRYKFASEDEDAWTVRRADSKGYYNLYIKNYISTAKVKIVKYIAGGSTPLAGAEFSLHKENEDGTGYVETAMSGFERLVSGEDGLVMIDKLSGGTYYLVEDIAPEGYNKLTEPVKIVVGEGQGESGASMMLKGALIEPSGPDSNGYYTYRIDNNPGYVLPESGGPGTHILYICGVMLLIAGASLIFKKKRL